MDKQTPIDALRQKLSDAETALMIVEPRPVFAQIALEAIQDAEALVTEIEHG